MANAPADPNSRDERVDRAILAYLEAVDAGRAPDAQDFLARYPDLADELRAFFADQEHTGRRTQPLRPAPDLGETVDETPAAAAHAPAQLPPGVGGYRLLRLLGEGGMGRVYEAEDASGRRVALKLIAPRLLDSPTTIERFRQEGQLASRVVHPRCVFVLRAEDEAGQPYIVMELMSGATLKDLVERQGPLAPADAVAKTLDVLEGLDEAHRAGVIHRDVKPANCYLDADGRVKVGDFGLARSLTAPAGLTQTGGFVGTPLFASPEQLKGEPLDPRTDVYSMAATLYYLLTGRAPFQHADAATVIARIASEPPPSPRGLRPEIPAALDRAVLRGLDRQRERRFQSPDEFREALLPLLPAQLTTAGLGLRVGANFFDGIPYTVYGFASGMFMASGSWPSEPVAYFAVLVPYFLYFWLTEGVWGCSVGKWLVGLRVTRADGWGPLGLKRALLRTAVYYALTETFWEVGAMVLSNQPLVTGWAGLGHVFGILVLCSTMRRRNGYRGLHDFLSGARVVQLPLTRRRLTLALRRPEGDPEAARVPGPALNPPAQVGRFRIRGVCRWDDDVKVLRAEDASLGRPVWVELRPVSDGPLPDRRRGLARPARLRWLTAGVQDGWQWDAFVAPAGAALADYVTGAAPLDWPTTRRVLEQLADELAAACADGTLPPGRLTPLQVWLDSSGAACLLDHPPRAATGLPSQGDSQRTLLLLSEVAVLALEGRPRSGAEGNQPIRAPVPLYARTVLDRLTGGGGAYENLARLQADWAATRQRPSEVTPGLRALHLGLTFTLLTMGFVSMLAVSRPATLNSVERLEQRLLTTRVLTDVLDDARFRAGLFAELPADHDLRARAPETRTFLAQRQAGDYQQLERRVRSLGVPLAGLYAQKPTALGRVLEGSAPLRLERLPDVPFALRVKGPGKDVREVTLGDLTEAAEREDRATGAGSFEVAALSLAVVPLCFAAWDFAFRGGVGLWLAGLVLVRFGGRKAWRLQCAWRALLVWLPVAFLLVPVVWIDAARPDWLWLCSPLQGLAVLLLAGYVALALRRPTRSLHDRLAGTYLVPR